MDGAKPPTGKMRALQIVAPGDARVVDCDVPTPGRGEVVVRVEGVTTCPHWDMHILEGRPMFADRPLSYPYVLAEPGHEMVGRVVSCGSGVQGLASGTRVAAWRDPGQRRQGCYAQYVAVDETDLLEVPEEPGVEAIAPLELAMCVQVSVDQLLEIDAVRDKRVAVSGLGPAGLIAVQILKSFAAGHITAIEPDEARRALGVAAGADAALHPDEVPTHGRFADDAFHATLDTTGLKRSIEPSMRRSQRAVAVFGVLREEIVFGPEQWWGGFSLIGYGQHNVGAARRVLGLVTSGELDLAMLVTERRGLHEYAVGVDRLRRKEAIKILFDPWLAPGDTGDVRSYE